MEEKDIVWSLVKAKGARNGAGRKLRFLLNITHDGDKTSLNIVYSDDAIKEGNDYLKSKEAFLSPSGGLNFGLGSSRNKLPVFVLHNFTSGLVD